MLGAGGGTLWLLGWMLGCASSSPRRRRQPAPPFHPGSVWVLPLAGCFSSCHGPFLLPPPHLLGSAFDFNNSSPLCPVIKPADRACVCLLDILTSSGGPPWMPEVQC